MFSGGVSEVVIQILSAVKWEMGITEYSKMANGRHYHMFSGGVSYIELQMLSTVEWYIGITPYVLWWSFRSRNTDVKYSKMVNRHHCHMFSRGVSEVEINMLRTVKWQMGITAIFSLVESRK